MTTPVKQHWTLIATILASAMTFIDGTSDPGARGRCVWLGHTSCVGGAHQNRRNEVTSTTIDKHLVDMERQYWQAIKDKDVNAAMELTDDKCLVAGASGVASINREAFAGMLNSSAWTLNEFEFVGDVQVRALTDDVATVAYKVKEQLTVDGKPLTLEAADASTWVRRNGRWMCALHTEAIMGDAFGRDRKPVSQESKR